VQQAIEIRNVDTDAELAGNGIYGHGLRHLQASDEEISELLS
jgi:hypothetical protein